MSGILRAAHDRLNARKQAVVEGAEHQVEGEVHNVAVFAPLFTGLDVNVADLDHLIAHMIEANWGREPEVLQALTEMPEATAMRMLTMVKGIATDTFLLGAFSRDVQADRDRAEGGTPRPA